MFMLVLKAAQLRTGAMEAEVTALMKQVMKELLARQEAEIRKLEGGGLPNFPAADSAAVIHEAQMITKAAWEADGKAP